MVKTITTQDFFLQNQSTRLVESALDKSNIIALNLAKVRYLQSVLPTPIIGTAGVVLMFCFLDFETNFQFELAIWLLLGLLVTYWRLFLLLGYGKWFTTNPPTDQLDSYLRQIFCTAALAGVTFGWGWLSFYSSLSPEIQMGFLFTNIVMLFGGLYAYSPHLPAFIAFSLFSLLPALWQLHKSSDLWGVQSVGITLVILVSQMFAFRWSQSFALNALLNTKNQNLVEELTQKKEVAEKATLAKSRFLAAVSHDLRQPLHAINLYLAVLKRTELNDQNTNQITECVNHLSGSAHQLTHMFEALLDVSKLDAGTTGPNWVNTSIEKLMNQLATEFTNLASNSGLTFQVKLPIQATLNEVLARTDPIMLERILRNLISNALAYTDSGGVRLRLRLKQKNGKYFYEFRVIDTGPGIQRNEHEKIFEEFYQTELAKKNSHKTSKFEKNMGLGLAISSRLASHLKTKIRLHSRPGLGSVFAFDIETSKRSDSEITSEKNNVDMLDDKLEQLFIAVIDDSPDILNSTTKLLATYGTKEILTASNLSELVGKINQATSVPDIFLLDYEIGVESGIDAIHAIRNNYGSHVRCILITGETSADHVALFAKHQLEVLYKPLTEKRLISTILKANND